MKSHTQYPPPGQEEQYLRRQIAEIQRQYQAQIKPLVDRLVAIRCRQLPTTWVELEKGEAIPDFLKKVAE